jgi:hypothetical protein
MDKINDLELDSIEPGEHDRLTDRNHVEVNGNRGMGGIKAIFHPANRKRLCFYGVASALVLSGLVYSYASVTAPVEQGGGSVSGGSPRTTKNRQPSSLQREDADRYNTTGLEEQQKIDPTAHPLIVTSEADEFPEERTFKAQKSIGSTIGEAQQPDQLPEHRPNEEKHERKQKAVPNQRTLELISQLVNEEGTKIPEYKETSWSYRQVAAPAAPAGQYGQVGVNGDGSATLKGELPNQCVNPIIRAGRQYVARATIAVNSDVGGPIMVEMVDGPLRKHRLIGKFTRKEDWLRTEFTDLVGIKDPKKINAIGLDMDTALNAVGGEVDYHTFYRYGWWGLGATLSAIGKAAQSSSDTTTVYVGDSVVQNTAKDTSRELKIAAGDLGQSIGEIMKSRINREPTVSLKVNDLVGIVFMDDVCGDK